MKNVFKLAITIGVCELAGLISLPITAAAIPTWYAALTKPPFTPPNWVFGPAWTILYLCMGIAWYLIWQITRREAQVKMALIYFAAQLIVNALWSPIFFGLRSPFLGLIAIGVLWLLIFITIRHFYSLSKLAGYLLIPYLAWVSFATLLNASVWLLN